MSILDQLSDVQVLLLNWLLTRETFKLNMVPVESVRLKKILCFFSFERFA